MALDLDALYATSLTPLHYEIEEFVDDVVPTQEERIFFEDLASIVDEQVVDLLGRKARAVPIGGFAMGLSTHASDLDIVVLKVVRVHSRGMRVGQRARAVKVLYNLAKRLAASKTIKLKGMRVIPRARVPVLKVVTADGTAVDVSLHNDSGIKAASHMRKTLKEYPSSIPIIIVLKCLLHQAGLSDVGMGGLGGYALANMVLTHCMELRSLGRPDLDCGEVLLGFLEAFGYDFDVSRQAASSRQGKIVQKSVLEKETLEWIRNTEKWQGRTNGLMKPFIEDPLSGQNIAIATTNFLTVQKCFRNAHQLLSQDTNLQEDVLPRLMDTEKLLKRQGWVPDDRYWTVKRALKREGYDSQKAGEDIRAFKKQLAHDAHRRRKNRGKKPKPMLFAEASHLTVLR